MAKTDATHLTSIVNHQILMGKFPLLQVISTHSQDDIFLLLPGSNNEEEEVES